jgi:PilZ domain
MVEQRTEPRLRTLDLGKISTDHGDTIDCVVVNRSSNGVCIEVDSPIRVPESFVLTVSDENIRRPCRVVWRLGKRIGVTFP